MNNYIIAIDGPSGSGKSTIAQKLSEILKIDYLNTGSMYRACSLYFLENNINEDSKVSYKDILKNIDIYFENQRIFLNGKDVTETIRNEEVTKNVSWVSSIKEVREFLVESQRKIAKKHSFILDGRDIGTVVFPDAKYKFYITASAFIRAKRRYDQGEIDKSLEEIEKDMIKRDNFDSTREISPLRKADDAIEIDSSNLTIDQTVDFILKKMDREDVL